MTKERVYETATETAKKIHKTLKDAFPGVKFSVRRTIASKGRGGLRDMKQEKRPTRQQRNTITTNGLIADNWFVERDTPREMVLIHRYTGRTRKIIKGA